MSTPKVRSGAIESPSAVFLSPSASTPPHNSATPRTGAKKGSASRSVDDSLERVSVQLRHMIEFMEQQPPMAADGAAVRALDSSPFTYGRVASPPKGSSQELHHMALQCDRLTRENATLRRCIETKDALIAAQRREIKALRCKGEPSEEETQDT